MPAADKTPAAKAPGKPFNWETAKLTERQKADFSALVDDWVAGKVPLDQAAAAVRARIAKLPSERPTPVKRAPRAGAVKTTTPAATAAVEAPTTEEPTPEA